MRLSAGIVTEKLEAVREFYPRILGFGITFENEFFLLLHTPGREAEISFLLPGHPSQHPVFQPPYTGQGVYLSIEVENVDAFYEEMQDQGVPIAFGLRDEPWGDRHFAILDPNGIAIDIVTHTLPQT